MRIAIVGNSGSGKSTAAHMLAARHGLASLDLDRVAWLPGQIAVPREPLEASAALAEFCTTHERWVIEGCYANLIEELLPRNPVLVLLDPGLETCLSNCRERPWEPHKYANKAEQDSKLEFLLDWVRDYFTRDGNLSLKAHRALFEAYAGPKFRWTERVDPRALETWLRG